LHKRTQISFIYWLLQWICLCL